MDNSTLDTLTAPLTEEKAVDVLRIPTAIVNTYIVGNPNGDWILVDTGLPGFAGYVQKMVESHTTTTPKAIVLTHGHFDHASNAEALADAWNVPVYAHAAELPFLTGRSNYPPGDPSMGGAIAQFSRMFPSGGFDLGNRVRALDEDGTVPGLSDWRWLYTPGHAPGHISLWRESDRYLIAGDAVATLDADNWASQVTHAREIARPPVPFTPDWDAAEESIRNLAELRPWTLAAGHGQIMDHPELAEDFLAFARRSHRPTYGRYAIEPARFDADRGVVSVPAPVEDRSLPWLLAGLGGIIAGGILIALLANRSDDDDRDAPHVKTVYPPRRPVVLASKKSIPPTSIPK